MKRAFARMAAATTLSLSVLVAGTAQPAQAVDPVTTAQVITAAVKAYEAWKSGQNTEQIVKAINEAKTAIIAHADALAAADAKACTRHAIIESADVHLLSKDVLTSWAQQVTHCVTLIDSLLDVVVDKPTLNQLGLALGSVGPLALATRRQAGLSTAGVQSMLIEAHTTVEAKAAPDCHNTREEKFSRILGEGAWRVHYKWGCTAADNTKVANYVILKLEDPAPAIDIPAIRAQVGRNTSWKLAQQVLPVLRAA